MNMISTFYLFIYITVNNWTEEEYNALKGMDYGYIIIGKEKGEEGTPHLQAYVQLNDKKRMNYIKEAVPRAHIEKARGSPDDNKKYCSKEGDFEEDGTMTSQGKKKVDWNGMVDKVRLNVPVKELLMEYGGTYVMNKRKIDDIADAIDDQGMCLSYHSF